MKRRIAMAVLCAMLLAISGSAAGQKAGDSKKKGPAAPGVVSADRGKFKIFSDGQPVGTEEFSVAPSGADWISRGSLEIKMPGAGTAQVSGELRLAADGRPLGYKWTSAGEKKILGSIVFEGAKAEMEIRENNGEPFTQLFDFDSPQVVVLDNNFYHHYGLFARLYDWNAKGVQTFSVVIPQDLAAGKVTLEWAGPRDLDGIKSELLRVRSSDLEIELYVADGKLVRMIVPESKAEIRRE
jgi:hypothetical protein